MLTEFFSREKIEYFSSLAYSDCRVIRPDIIAREDFIPRSVIIYIIPYYAGVTVNISKYAAARDYHIYVRALNNRLIAELKSSYPENSFKGFGDSSPIDERMAALSAGLGILGDNGLLINEKYGSYVFVAEIISDLAPEVLGVSMPKEPKYCEHCGECKKHCPTGHLENNCSECLSSITQKKGELSVDEVQIMRKYGTVWGCDVCQDVCPHNKNPKITHISFFREGRIEELTDKVLDAMDKTTFSERAFSWRGRKTVERNLEYLK